MHEGSEVARQLIEQLELQPHPEGGYYREIYRSAANVGPGDDRPSRSAVTTIYYMLTAGQQSRWHQVRSDEIWHFYGGEPLVLFLAPPSLERVEEVRLNAVHPVHVVPPDWWQATRPTGAYGLAGCTVAPGFEFEDFALMADRPMARATLERLHPHLLSLV